MAEKQISIFDLLSEPIVEVIKEHELSEDSATDLIETLVAKGPKDLLKAIKQEALAMVEADRLEKKAFEGRNYKRWEEPLNLLTLLWRYSTELAENHSLEGPQDGDCLVFDTLAHLQPKALLVTGEILCLLEGGYADGALARWRTLHEIVVTAMFIAKHGHKAALGYRLSMWFENSRAAKQVNRYASRAGIEPLSVQELDEIEAVRAEAEKQLGKVLKTDWDWADDILPTPKKGVAGI